MSFLPYIDETGNLIDGACFHLIPFCIKNCLRGKCKDYYATLKDAKAGSYRCPYGLSSYVYSSPMGRMIFSGLRIKGKYDKTKAKNIRTPECVFNPIVSEDVCSSIVHEAIFSECEKRELEEKLEAIQDLLHETRSLNGRIKVLIDSLWESNLDEDNIERAKLFETLKSVQVSSVMISNRFSYFDSVLNPTLLAGEAYPAVVFKKFDKMRKLLRGYLHKNVWISIDSPIQSDYRYRVYPTFETLLFILLENAVKYSPEGKPVEVYFEENKNLLDVTIKSIGPYSDDNEILHLCEKGFRGENAKIAQDNGQGFGLNFAKKICKAHEIDISFQSVYSHKDHGIKYGDFIVHLHFNNQEHCI